MSTGIPVRTSGPIEVLTASARSRNWGMKSEVTFNGSCPMTPLSMKMLVAAPPSRPDWLPFGRSWFSCRIHTLPLTLPKSR